MSFQKSYSNHSINPPIGDTSLAYLSSPDPVAIAVNGEEPQPDQHSPETQEKFNHWFNHGWDSIYKPPTDESWLTAKFSITPSQIWEKWQNPDTLIGLRFGVNTRYGLIDIDYGSKYHSDDGLRAINGALETIGINETILIRSSFSEGFWLLYFLPELVNSFQLAQTKAIALRENGLEIEPGQLEIFPNVKGYGREKKIAFSAHRLPLQPGSGSYLLDDDFQPYSNSIDTFLSQADQAASSVDFDVLRVALETASDRYRELFKGTNPDNLVDLFGYKKGKKVKQWESETDVTIWTSHGQTNKNLKAITDKGRVFKGITDERELAEFIHSEAIASPGYQEYCRHKHEIKKWCERWARWGMIHRFPYGSRGGEAKKISKGGPTNEEKKALTMIKLIECMEDLRISGRLESGVRKRQNQLISLLGISKNTLWKPEYLPYWHEKSLSINENIAIPETLTQQELRESLEMSPHAAMNSMGAGEAEYNLLILSTEGSDRIVDKIQSSEIYSQEINQKPSFPLFELPAATSKGFEISEPLDMQAFKARKDTAKLNTSIINNLEKEDCLVSQKMEALKVGDRVYHIERPSYGLTITQIVNDELVKALTDGFKGAEYFPINELMAQLPTDGCSPTKGRSP
jgi:hypothetical protein